MTDTDSRVTLPAPRDELVRWTLAVSAAVLILSGILLVSTPGSGSLWFGVATLAVGVGALVLRLRAARAGWRLESATGHGRGEESVSSARRAGPIRAGVGAVLRGALGAVIFGAVVAGLKLILTATGEVAVASYAAFGIVLLVSSPVLDRVT